MPDRAPAALAAESVAGPFVKICGLRTLRDVQAAVAGGADAVGFVFTPSVRRISITDAAPLVAAATGVLRVGVFIDEPATEIREVVRRTGIDAIQLHGDHGPDDFAQYADLGVTLIRATAFSSPDLVAGAYGEDLLLVDASRPGSGKSWEYAALAGGGGGGAGGGGAGGARGKWLLAGGLTVENVSAALAASGAWGVDVSSGVESTRGVKDPELITAFIAAAKRPATEPS